jgi:hypothetical protein
MGIGDLPTGFVPTFHPTLIHSRFDYEISHVDSNLYSFILYFQQQHESIGLSNCCPSVLNRSLAPSSLNSLSHSAFPTEFQDSHSEQSGMSRTIPQGFPDTLDFDHKADRDLIAGGERTGWLTARREEKPRSFDPAHSIFSLEINN